MSEGAGSWHLDTRGPMTTSLLVLLGVPLKGVGRSAGRLMTRPQLRETFPLGQHECPLLMLSGAFIQPLSPSCLGSPLAHGRI